MQKMVMALSTDKAVWNAVMNNDVVQEFKRSFKDGMQLLDSVFASLDWHG
jgi:hypothetical protein